MVTNLSKEKTITVFAANVYGTDLKLDFPPLTILPGQTRSIDIKGEIPEGSVKNFEIGLSYMIGTITLIGERVFEFTLMNGDAAEYDEANPFADADPVPGINKVLDEETDSILTKYGFKNIAAIIYNIIMTFVELVNKIISVVK